jgi:hypothetical protein
MQRHLNEYEGYKEEFSNIIYTANPLTKAGNRPSIIHDAHCYLTVSVVIKCSNSDGFSGRK